MGTAEPRCALDELEAVRRKDADERPVRGVEEALEWGAVEGYALGFSRREADRDLVLAVLVRAFQYDTRRGGAKAHQLALVGGSKRPRRAGEIERLEQVCLAAGVGAVHQRQSFTQRHLGILVAAEVAHTDTLDLHSGSRAQADRHDQIDESTAVSGFDQTRAQRTGQLDQHL